MIKIYLLYTKTGDLLFLLHILMIFLLENWINILFYWFSTLENDEFRHELQEGGQFHLGDHVNVFRHGSLVMEHFTDSYVSVQGGILYGTCNGALGNVKIF